MSDHWYGHEAPVNIARPKSDVEFRRPSEVWQFVDEHISAVGSETYPWNPEIVKAIREFEPDFCPLWVVSVYVSPAGTIEKFGRHAIGKDYRFYDPDEKVKPFKVHTASYGVNAGRRPVMITDILQNKDVRVIPDLSVFGYRPLDWTVYYAAKKDHWVRKHSVEQDVDPGIAAFRKADAIRQAEEEETQRKRDAINEKASYGWDFDTDRGKKLKNPYVYLAKGNA